MKCNGDYRWYGSGYTVLGFVCFGKGFAAGAFAIQGFVGLSSAVWGDGVSGSA